MERYNNLTQLIDWNESKRTHDKFYLSEDREIPIKDSFVMVADHIELEFGSRISGLKMADIGCAVGVFPNYLRNRFPSLDITGCEYDDELLNAARAYYPEIKFCKFDITNSRSCNPSSFDIISVCGVLSIFDQIGDVFRNLLRWTRPGGKIFIFNMFNPNDIDVFVRYKRSGSLTDAHLESGWNIPSQATVREILSAEGISDFQFDLFNISTDLRKVPNDPVRSWTEKDEEGRRLVVNGLCLMQPFYLLTIRV